MPIFFHRKEEGEVQSIGVEYDLIEIAPDMMTPKLSYLFFKTDEPIEDLEDFFNKSSVIQALIKLEGLAYFAGIRAIDGWVELYFYSRDSKLLRSFILERLPENLHYELSSKPDKKWRFFFDILMPKQSEKLSIQNRYVLEELKEAGDDFKLEHEFIHTFYLHTKAQSERLQKALQEQGYTFYDSYTDEESEKTQVLQMSHTDIITQERVDDFCIKLYEWALKEHGLYDGWSTELASKEQK